MGHKSIFIESATIHFNIDAFQGTTAEVEVSLPVMPGESEDSQAHTRPKQASGSGDIIGSDTNGLLCM